jgi:hypothetical protein
VETGRGRTGFSGSCPVYYQIFINNAGRKPGSKYKEGTMSYGKWYNMKTALVPLALLLALSGCPQPEGGGTPFELAPEIPRKLLKTDNTTPVEAVCYVDTEQYSPLNAKDYVFTNAVTGEETLFFNYVVLGYAYLSKNERGYASVKMTRALQRILADTGTYIKPLHQKGIKVLLQIRSGSFSDAEEGDSLGWGTMDMAAIEILTKELKRLVDHYGLDGFEFDDTGGGKNAYPPFTRNLIRSDGQPQYSEDLFQDELGDELSPETIEAKLWIEGGSNFSNLIQRTNEALKEFDIPRSLLVRRTGHGDKLIAHVRMAYMPDAYTGAKVEVAMNLNYIVNAASYDGTKLHPYLYSEEDKVDVGADSDNSYTPFAIDVADQKPQADATNWANTFLLKDPGGSSSDSANWNRYGALYITNLGPVSETAAEKPADYLTYFSNVIFGRRVRLSASGTGDYKKTW